MAEETYNTNKGMNYSFTPTLMEIEKTISLPMLSRKIQTHSVPVLSFCQVIQIKVWIISKQALI